MGEVIINIDSRLRVVSGGLPRDLANALKRRFQHPNPDFHKKTHMGLSTWQTPREIIMHGIDENGDLTFPRGGAVDVKATIIDHGHRAKWIDNRTTSPVEFPRFTVNPDHPEWELRPYQLDAIRKAEKKQQGIVRAPTGSGKSLAALALVHALGQRAIVILKSKALLEQWKRVAMKSLGLASEDISLVMGGKKFKPGNPLTLALQQSLNGAGRIDKIFDQESFGLVIVDECQLVGAKTFIKTVNQIPCKYRIGFSADERRRDGLENVIYDVMGPKVMEISRQSLEAKRVIEPVTVRLVPTDFRADWYRDAEAGEKSFSHLIAEMVEDHDRNDILVDTLCDIVRESGDPALVFTHRREHAAELVEDLAIAGIRAGLMLGGSGDDAARFKESQERLEVGLLQIAIGTFQSIGVGIDIPLVRSGVCATPISARNPQFFNQVRGRICRSSEGKDSAHLYYMWDQHVFPDQPWAISKWNDGLVEMKEGGKWKRVK
jgi:superfamily II DNA or RNA helicase